MSSDDMIKLLNQKDGFSLVEALVAQAILIIGSLAVWSVFVAGSRYNSMSEDRTIAIGIAQYLLLSS